MTSLASQPSVKVIGANGQISLGKQFAGRQVLVEESEPGVWMVRTATVVPDNERWVHEAKASADLGGGTLKTVRSVVVPMIIPGIIAGSIFSFSLTLGDYIAVKIVGGATQTIGTLIYTNVGTANNLPLAAAIAFVPLVIILIYLASVKRTGALENL